MRRSLVLFLLVATLVSCQTAVPDKSVGVPERWASMRGTWVLPRMGQLLVEHSEGTLVVRRGGVRYRMVPVGNQFHVPALDLRIEFSSETIHVSSNFDEEWGTRQENRISLPGSR